MMFATTMALAVKRPIVRRGGVRVTGVFSSVVLLRSRLGFANTVSYGLDSGVLYSRFRAGARS
jgi:hypothetical protein